MCTNRKGGSQMFLGIVGSRSISFADAKPHILAAITKHKPSVVVSGGAKGVDTWASQIATDLGIQVIEYIPNWRLGKHAGFLRNTTIAENSDHILCIFPGGVPSGGTADTLKKAKKLGKGVTVVCLGSKQLMLL